MMLNPHRFLLRASQTIFLIGISVSVATSVVAQTGDSPDPASLTDRNATLRLDIAFDVVSIRPSHAGPDQTILGPLGDQYKAIGFPLGWTILVAYFPFRLQTKDQIVGAPGWVWNDDYDFVGKVGDADLPAWQRSIQGGFPVRNAMLQAMLQKALADRCKMTVHRVPTRIDGYALVLAKHGPNRKKLVESKPDDVIPDQAHRIPLYARLDNEDPVRHFYQTSMAALIIQLSLRVPIEDRTGLSGKFNFDLTRLETEGIPSDWDLAPLGLKLIPTKILSESIVIDKIERPSPN